MPSLVNLTGKTFGRLTVIRRATIDEVPNPRRVYWLCRCDCGKLAVIRSDNLVTGYTRSCGCYCDEVHKRGKHKLTRSTAHPLNGWDNF